MFFFDLPTKDELEVIWKIWIRKFGLDNQPLPNDDGWVGRNIKKCCEKAYLKGVSLLDAAKTEIAWGHQIRSYVFFPYQQVKDHRTEFTSHDIVGVMDGHIEGFVHAFLTQPEKPQPGKDENRKT